MATSRRSRRDPGVVSMRIDDLLPSQATLVGADLDCIADGDGRIDHGLALHIARYCFDDLGIDDPESQEWVEDAVRAAPGVWTARLCRSMHDAPETKAAIAHCGLCKEFANSRKRLRAKQLPPATLPGFEQIGGAYQLYPRCGRRGLTWLRHLLYRLRDRDRLRTKREPIPDSRQPRGWDWGTRLYAVPNKTEKRTS